MVREWIIRSILCSGAVAAGLTIAHSAHAQSGVTLVSANSLAMMSAPAGDQVGLATWYGEDFDGRVTAAGDRFDMYGLTAAHPSLPLNSTVEVTNLENGRKLTLRVNDRRAPAPGGVIVLSKAAAANLGFVQEQSARVRVRYLSAPGARTASSGGWTQAASQ
jgi:rare lipoprotein A